MAKVELRPEPFTGLERLFYVNLGGYAASEFAEKHKNVFIVATSVSDAKKRALKEAKPWKVPHRDEMYEAEQAFSLMGAASTRQLYIHLTASEQTTPLNFICAYTPIRRRP